MRVLGLERMLLETDWLILGIAVGSMIRAAYLGVWPAVLEIPTLILSFNLKRI